MYRFIHLRAFSYQVYMKEFSSLKRTYLSPKAKSIRADNTMKSSIFSDDSPKKTTTKRKYKELLIHDSNHSDNGNSTDDLQSIHKSNTLNYIPGNDNNEDSDSDELVDISMLQPPTKKKFSDRAKSLVDKQTNDSKVEIRQQLDKLDKVDNSKREGDKNNNESHKAILQDNNELIEGLYKDENKVKEQIKHKFKDYEIPDIICSRKELFTRVERHLDMIPKLINGQVEMSCFYNLAKEQCQLSDNETLTQRDKWNIDWIKFYGGYYGFERQQFIATIINIKFKSLLTQSSKKNPTIAFWQPLDFCKYVLANEIIIRLVMEDYKCLFDKAERIVRDTSEYGKAVVDSIELEDDLALEALYQEDYKKFVKEMNSESPKQINSNSPKKKGLLDKVFSDDSD